MMHQNLIALLGLPIGKLWNLHDLAADHRDDRLLTVTPLNLTGE